MWNQNCEVELPRPVSCESPIKVISTILFLIVAVALEAQAQESDSTNFYASFYPLAIGSSWQYERASNFGGSADLGFYPFKEIVGDTTMSNGRQYQIVATRRMGTADIQYQYERIDLDELIVYRFAPSEASQIGLGNMEVPALFLPSSVYPRSFSGNGNSLWSLTCTWGVFSEVLGDNRLEWMCLFSSGSYYTSQYHLAAEIGMSEYHESRESYSFSDKLIYFQSGGRQLGIPVSSESHIEVPPKESLSVFPNPADASSLISVEWPGPQESGSMRIIDSLGREVYPEISNRNIGSLTIRMPSSASQGLYFVSIRLQSKTLTGKFILLGGNNQN